MKTNIELSDELVRNAKGAAIERRTTLRQLVENGLRRELASPTVSSESQHPLASVARMGCGQWPKASADAYVKSQRVGW